MVPTGNEPRARRELGKTEALRRLSSVRFGRVVFTQHALPAVQPVSHIVDGDWVVFCSHGSAALAEAAQRGTVLAYQADEIDQATQAAWSVLVTGLAQPVDDPAQAGRYLSTLEPWLAGQMGHVIRIEPKVVTGFELNPGGQT